MIDNLVAFNSEKQQIFTQEMNKTLTEFRYSTVKTKLAIIFPNKTEIPSVVMSIKSKSVFHAKNLENLKTHYNS